MNEPAREHLPALTPAQRRVLDFIVEFIRAKRYSPSLEEIAAALELRSVATIHKHLRNLSDKGYVKRSWNRSRSIEVVPEALIEARNNIASLTPDPEQAQSELKRVEYARRVFRAALAWRNAKQIAGHWMQEDVTLATVIDAP